MQRSKIKENLINNLEQRLKLTPISEKELPISITEYRFTPIKLTAKLDNTHVFLLDNQTYRHQVGYKVLVPIDTTNKQTTIIDRGFISKQDLKADPTKLALKGSLALNGFLNIPTTGLILKKDSYQKNLSWPVIIQAFDPAFISQCLEKKVKPYTIQLFKDNSASLAQELPSFGLSKEKHLGYAFQWFSLAGLIVLYYIIYLWKKVKGFGHGTTTP